jgi:hypothetical protein
MAKRRPQFVLPDAVDDRLERLLNLAREEGNNVSRSDIVATLIWHARLDGDALGLMTRQYRREVRTANSSAMSSRPPGPRPLLTDPAQ